MIASLQLTATVVFGFMTLMFLLSLRLRDNSIADVCWGIGGLLVVITTWFQGPPKGTAQTLISAAVLLWAVRLAVYVFSRNRGKPEDRRYAEMRQRWIQQGHEKLYSFVYVFMLQAALIVTISLPIIAANSRDATSVNPLNLVAAGFWLVGFLFEAVGDYQLSRFRKTHTEPNAVLQTGIWRYTRHPNYFGEALMWWCIALMAVRQPGDLWLLGSPAMVTFLLLRISGIPLAEKKRRDHPEYAAYVRRTNAFFPGPPK